MRNANEFEAFVQAHQDMVFAIAVRLLGNPAEAEDVAQSVFLKAFERFDQLAASPSAAGWLKTVARNACLNHLSRYRSRWRFFSELADEQSDTEGDARPISDSSPSALQRLEQADDRAQLERALRNLPDHQRVPLVLFHFEEASYDEIATLLGVSLAKVKTDIHRGREALRRLLEARLPASARQQASSGEASPKLAPDRTASEGGKPDTTSATSTIDHGSR